jgi:uracil-DNA glycosylase
VIDRFGLPGWERWVESFFASADGRRLSAFLAERRAAGAKIYPPQPLAALAQTPFDSVRVVILGQDPYHGNGQAHGLAFSVLQGVRPPPSLRNILAEVKRDLGREPAPNALVDWARQGVLLLNATLTVRARQAASHQGKGWETFTDEVIRAVAAKQELVVFILWGASARKKRSLIDTTRHVVIESAHPSPLSARNGFFGSRPFSRANEALAAAGREPVDWRIPPR